MLPLNEKRTEASYRSNGKLNLIFGQRKISRLIKKSITKKQNKNPQKQKHSPPSTLQRRETEHLNAPQFFGEILETKRVLDKIQHEHKTPTQKTYSPHVKYLMPSKKLLLELNESPHNTNQFMLTKHTQALNLLLNPGAEPVSILDQLLTEQEKSTIQFQTQSEIQILQEQIRDQNLYIQQLQELIHSNNIHFEDKL